MTWLLFTPFGCSSNSIQPIEKSPDGEGLDARPITELAGRRTAGARPRVNNNRLFLSGDKVGEKILTEHSELNKINAGIKQSYRAFCEQITQYI